MNLTRPTGHAAALLALLLAAGCTTTSLNEAPIIDRSERRGPSATAPAPAVPPAVREARDGSYVVQRGDTLYSIALAFGQDYRDLARWNGLDDPSKLQVGQTLRVQPPTDASPAVVAAPVAPVAAAEVRPLDAPLPSLPSTGAAATPSAPAPVPATPPAAASTAPATSPAGAAKPVETKPATPATPESALNWAWPAAGKVVEAFDESRNKGIDIAGKEGDPVLAAGDGQVVYKGNALRGYGNLVIVKHSDDFISAYAHNRQILVEHGQSVKRGQRIAEMGKSDADFAKLHFEIRRQGKPVDPTRFLPAR